MSSANDDFIDAFIATREALLREADGVATPQRQTPFVGHWTLMNVLAHLIGWDYTNVEAVKALRSGLVPAFYAHYDAGWASYNQQLIERYGDTSWDCLRDSIRESQATVVATLRALSPEDWSREIREPGRRRPVTLAAILRAAIRDESEHLEQIRRFAVSHREDG